MKLIIILFVVAVLFFIIYLYNLTKKDPHYIINHLKKYDSASLTVLRNGETLASVNPNVMLPLASTVKIIVAIEYARQCESERIDPSQVVCLNELDNYYIPRTDGGAHKKWIKHLEETNEIKDDQTTIENIAKGMIHFSSNANTEYLIDLLSNEKVNHALEFLQVENHDPIYPFVSSMLIPTYLKQQNPEFTKEKLYNELKSMSMEKYVQLSFEIFEKLKAGGKKELVDRIITNKKLQRIWSDRLPSSTTAEYAAIMKKLNSKLFLAEGAQKRLDPVMEGLMENPNNQKWLSHAGQKGGSTLFIATNATYATDKSGNRTEIAFFANNLDDVSSVKILRNLNGFNLQMLTNESFREKLKRI